jgi:hypothetical protein
MHKEDDLLHAALHNAQQQVDGLAPSFDAVFSAAKARISRNRRRRFASLAAAAAVAALAIAMLPNQQDDLVFVNLDELIATTNWSAPSDSLLPTHQFDIYRELPQLIDLPDVSTKYDEGALL